MSEFLENIRDSISREEMGELPLRQFQGEITIVETQAMVREAVDALSQAGVLGFDTETKPSFRKGDNHQVALLQLATRDKAWLFRVKKTGLPREVCR